MDYTHLGDTGLEVSRICLGCMSYGDPNWRGWVLDPAAARPHFERALEHGINFFDTADMYSLGVSEEATGQILGSLASREDYVLAARYSTVTVLARFRGWSTSHPRHTAMW